MPWYRGGLAGAGLALLLVISAPAATSSAQAATPPNIVVIVTDDQRPATFTPELMPEAFSLLAGGRGTRLDVTLSTPLCCPYRAGLLSGQYGHNNGVLDNVPGYRALKGKGNVLPVWLQRAGYRTAHFGKFLNGYASARRVSRVPPGWDKWRSSFDSRYLDYSEWIDGREVRRGSAPGDNYIGRVGDSSARWAGRAARRKAPFYLQIDQLAPHFEVGQSSGGPCATLAIPEQEDEDLLAEEPPATGPSYNEADVSDKPSFIRELPLLSPELEARADLARRCERAALAGVDRAIGELRGRLAAAGELQRTAILITTDNGLLLGEHRLIGSKILPYAEANQVPLLARLPRRLRGASAPTASDVAAANVDLTATVLDLAGAEPCRRTRGRGCRTLDGRSLLPALRGRRTGVPARRPIPLEYETGVEIKGASCSYYGVRSGDQSWVRHLRAGSPSEHRCRPVNEVEHYDLAADPGQLENLAGPGSVAAAPGFARLARLAAKLRDCAGIAGRDRRRGGRSFCR